MYAFSAEIRNGMPVKQSSLDIHSSNLISVNLADLKSWQDHKGFDKPDFREVVSILHFGKFPRKHY
jgi:hypothetical protein